MDQKWTSANNGAEIFTTLQTRPKHKQLHTDSTENRKAHDDTWQADRKSGCEVASTAMPYSKQPSPSIHSITNPH